MASGVGLGNICRWSDSFGGVDAVPFQSRSCAGSDGCAVSVLIDLGSTAPFMEEGEDRENGLGVGAGGVVSLASNGLGGARGLAAGESSNLRLLRFNSINASSSCSILMPDMPQDGSSVRM